MQGVMLAALVRQRYPKRPITETHPKALPKAKHLEAQGWPHIASDFGFYGAEPKSADRVDALVFSSRGAEWIDEFSGKPIWQSYLDGLRKRLRPQDRDTPPRIFHLRSEIRVITAASEENCR